MFEEYTKNSIKLAMNLFNDKYTTKEEFLNYIKKSENLDYIESEDDILVIPKTKDKYVKVIFDYGKCPECGFDLFELGCLRCMNKDFIDSI